ncbi:hypothetical protein [Actinoplanes sp. NPDC026619]|uniref:hypothetical protein n=1 Tax=Actinoplanes sp. NPDC026619 TaxID=3155798 RepID=UPI0034080B28
MPADDAELWQLLRSLDDPGHLEFPANYDHRTARARFERLAQQLNASFGNRCDVDRQVQDDLGYTLIPEEPLWRPYDGAGISSTWWNRYFDYT